MTHREGCQRVTGWLLHQPWCHTAIWEISIRGGIADAVGVSDPLAARRHADDLELYRREGWKLPKRLKRPPGKGRITAVEFKRTRGDLVSDLKAGKMLGYQEHATHCYLALSIELDTPRLDDVTGWESYLADLRRKGLPRHWGVLSVGEKKRPRARGARNDVMTVRAARPTGLEVTNTDLVAMTSQIARSTIYRLWEQL